MGQMNTVHTTAYALKGRVLRGSSTLPRRTVPYTLVGVPGFLFPPDFPTSVPQTNGAWISYGYADIQCSYI
jgi:hypothetical protein